MGWTQYEEKEFKSLVRPSLSPLYRSRNAFLGSTNVCSAVRSTLWVKAAKYLSDR